MSVTRWGPIHVPLVLPASRTWTPLPTRRSSRCTPLTRGSATTRSFVAWRPTVARELSIASARPAPGPDTAVHLGTAPAGVARTVVFSSVPPRTSALVMSGPMVARVRLRQLQCARQTALLYFAQQMSPPSHLAAHIEQFVPVAQYIP